MEGFKCKVQDWWNSFNVTGRANYKLTTKLSLLKVKLKEWSKENKGYWRARKDQLLEQIGSLEIIQKARPLTNDE